MVATSNPLAAQVGLEMLKKGGNAIDAAISTAAAMTVFEPTSNGIGSDAFALVWSDDKLYGLNSSGPAPKNISLEKVKEKGHKNMPVYGFDPVTVPGAPASWAALSQKFGHLPFKELLKPAIKYAEEGFPVSPTTATLWGNSYNEYSKELKEELFKYWFETFAPKGRAPKPGEIWRSTDHADTLSLIAETDSRSFYQGEIAEKIISFSNEYTGYLSKEDLTEYNVEWVEPIGIEYDGYKIWEIPPNGQGLVALMALNILKRFDYKAKNTAETYHRQIEAIKLAFSDGKKFITDPKEMPVSVEDLLSSSYAKKRSKLINNKALTPKPGKSPEGGTIYLATADNQGNMVSFIQSNYKGFGSGLVVPGTGIALQNRGNNFSLDPEHSNCLKPGKKTYHTIIPGFITKEDKPIGPFGVMGGFMQPQGHVQTLMNMINFNLNPQAALDAPRWQWLENKKVLVESNFPASIARQLSDKGHDIEVSLSSLSFGRGQIICKDWDNNILIGGTEPRADSSIALF